MDAQDLKYPVGRYKLEKSPSQEKLYSWIREIEEFPTKLENLIKNINEEQLSWRYRPDGWNVRQVIHHCADSHTNSFFRFKLALTEDQPTIKPYFEDRWALLEDYNRPIEDSILILKGLHNRWVSLLRALSPTDLSRSFVHPEHNKTYNLAETVGLYAWHSRHHLGHIDNAISSGGKY